ncbi:Protein of unknown function [Gryllus bimaculatus]|nr:Protein of unknown function [Gryllus bimaculatus]
MILICDIKNIFLIPKDIASEIYDQWVLLQIGNFAEEANKSFAKTTLPLIMAPGFEEAACKIVVCLQLVKKTQR